MAQADTAAITYPHETVPKDGETVEMAPGVHWVRMPLPYALDHINLWLLEDGDGWTIVDTGLKSRRIRELWEQIFAARLEGRPVRRVIVTHHHPDHIGLAGWLVERWGVPLWAPLTEWLFARVLTEASTIQRAQDMAAYCAAVGLPEHHIEGISERLGLYANVVAPLPREMRRIMDGDRIAIDGRDWRVIVGEGHAPEHACLYSEALGVLISGDHVLPRISPNVSVWPNEPEANPLKLFMATLGKFRELSDETLVLPSHNRPFYGLGVRIAQLIAHHEDRLAVLDAAFERPHTVIETLPLIFDREIDLQQSLFAVGEALAHLNWLCSEGRLVREVRADGVWLFRRAANAAA